MSFHESILRSAEPLEKHERIALQEWLETLRDDCETFGAAPEDEQRMASIERRLSIVEASDA